ncbi:MAG TPA: ATP-binding protein [Thermoanaerobaculia bacterium]|nr:ATP-binding protein [Thermoanaerobaculia bacterium]
MHPLRVLLIVSLVIATAVAVAFGALLARAGVSTIEAVVLAVAVFVAFLIPWGGVSFWAIRRANDLESLIDRTRDLVEHDESTTITDRAWHGELDELARAIEELRTILTGQRASTAADRSAIDQIIDILDEGLMAVSATGRVVLANARVAEMFDSATPLAGRSVLEVVRKRAVVEAIEGALRGKATEGKVISTEGSQPRRIEIRAVPLKSSSEIAAVGLFIDVSDLERLRRIRRDFLDDFSHEVRTPLAGLRSAAETLSAGGLTAEHEEAVRNVMSRQIHRIERLVRDISELNRIESGELVLERRLLDLQDVVADVRNEFHERQSDRGAKIIVRGEPAPASADPVRLHQILANLLDNALKHGGDEVIIETGRDDRESFVRVLDNGEGIPDDEVDRVFNRFYRVDRSRSQDVPGLGLGLSIVKHLAALHSGSVRAYNREEGGAAFELRLPAA